MTPFDYYLQVYEPANQFAYASERNKMLASLRAFERFSPDAHIKDVTHDLMQRFEEFAYEQFGVTKGVRYVGYLNRLLNDYHGNRKFSRQRPEDTSWGCIADSELWQFFLKVYKPRRLPNASASTVNQYRTQIKRLSALVGHPAGFVDLTDDTLSAIMGRIVTEGRSPTTANGVRAKLLALARYAAQRGLMREVPDVQKLSQYRRLPVTWEPEQFARLLNSCLQEQGEVDGIQAAGWWYALHLVLWDTAARLGAVLKVKQQDVDLRRGTMFVLAEYQKHKADQLWHLHDETLDALRRIWHPERRLLFPWSLCEASLFGHYKRILLRARLPADRAHKFHAIRRTHATLLASVAGLGAASLSLGHSSPDVTRESYVNPAAIPGAVALLPRPRGGEVANAR